MSFIDVIIRLTSPPRAFLGQIRGRTGYYDLKLHKKANPVDRDIVIYRFTAPLIFANISFFKKDMLGTLKNENKPKAIIIEGNGISYIDSTAMEELGDIIDRLKKEGVEVYFVDLIHRAADYLEDNGLKDFVCTGHVKKTVDEVLSEVKEK